MTEEFDHWRAETDAAIAAALAAQESAASVLGPWTDDLLEPLRQVSAGGKRVRALLLLASHRAHAGTSDGAAVGVAAALELFQTAALVHDDVLDGSDTRRGRPSLHRQVESLHARHEWHGDAEQFGEAGAVLAGDLALMTCQRALRDGAALLPPTIARTVSTLFSDMADIVTLGQYADMRAAAAPLATLGDQEHDIRAVMRAKTASYTAEFPLALGAAIAGAEPARVEAMREVGLLLGHAFQLRDDLLGLTGSPATTGKPAGDDIREGKRTLVVWRAWTQTDGRGREAISAVLGDRGATDTAIAAALDVVRATDALTWAEAEISRSAQRAREALAELALEAGGTAALEALVTYAIDRTA